MPLYIGQWNAVVNGEEVVLNIMGVDAPSGQVHGEIGGLPFQGVWNEIAQRISFVALNRLPPAGLRQPDPLAEAKWVLGQINHFNGCLMQTPRNPPPGADLIWTLAGTFDSCTPNVGINRRTTLGWYATIRQVV